MQVVPDQALIQAGQSVAVDVFVSGAANLRSYQVSLAITGGESGLLTAEEISIAHDRQDYVFLGKQKFDAVDEDGGRIGSVLMSGGVTRPGASYLGTYVLRASDDASGTFQVSVKDVTGRDSILWSANNTDIRFSTPVAEISVGHETDITPTRVRK